LQKSREAEVLPKIAAHVGAATCRPQNQKEYILEIYKLILKTSKDMQEKLI